MAPPQLIVMLTKNDKTVEEALDIFELCTNSKVCFWGVKEQGLHADKLKVLFDQFKKHGKRGFLEVASYSEKEGLDGAKLAKECGCKTLLGTCFYDSVNAFCIENDIKYMPFVGDVSGRPSVLNGSPEELIKKAKEYLKKGVYGFDLLGYRYTGDAFTLNKKFISEVDAPVCLAGSINSFERLDEVLIVAPKYFTIGGAFFNKCFGNTFPEQLDAVYDYICNHTF